MFVLCVAGNGSKEGSSGVAAADLPDEQPDVWRSQQHNYGAAGMASADPYLSSYYGGAAGYPPYQAFGVGDGAWSSGGDHLAFMGGYSQPPVQPDSYALTACSDRASAASASRALVDMGRFTAAGTTRPAGAAPA